MIEISLMGKLIQVKTRYDVVPAPDKAEAAEDRKIEQRNVTQVVSIEELYRL